MTSLPHGTILHTYPEWLPLTANWIFNLVTHIPGYPLAILTEREQNRASFHYEPILDLSNSYPWQFRMQYAMRKFRLVRQLPLYRTVFQEAQPRMIHSHFANFAWRDAAVAKSLKIPQIISVYGADVSMLPFAYPKWKNRLERLFPTVEAIVCEGPAMAEKVLRLGADKGRVHIIPLGVDLAQIQYQPRFWNRREGPLKILLAASFKQKKGIPDALRALGPIARKISLEISVVGDATPDRESQSEKEKIYRVVRENGLLEQTRFHGYISHEALKEMALEYHIFLQASKRADNGDDEGGAPVALIDMAASGMPLVSTTHCDIGQIIENNRTGFLGPEGDIEGIRQGVQNWIDLEGKWEPYLSESRRHVETKFNVINQAAAVGDLYGQLLT